MIFENQEFRVGSHVWRTEEIIFRNVLINKPTGKGLGEDFGNGGNK